MKNILIVDDEKKIRKIFSNFLVSEGFKAYEVANAMEVPSLLLTENIDLILLDIDMPEIDGGKIYNVIEIIRIFNPKIKVIVASVFPVEEQKQKISSAADYYDKSEGIEVLLKKIKRVFPDEQKEKKLYF